MSTGNVGLGLSHASEYPLRLARLAQDERSLNVRGEFFRESQGILAPLGMGPGGEGLAWGSGWVGSMARMGLFQEEISGW